MNTIEPLLWQSPNIYQVMALLVAGGISSLKACSLVRAGIPIRGSHVGSRMLWVSSVGSVKAGKGSSNPNGSIKGNNGMGSIGTSCHPRCASPSGCGRICGMGVAGRCHMGMAVGRASVAKVHQYPGTIRG